MKLVEGSETRGTRIVEAPDGEPATLTWGDDWWSLARPTGPESAYVYEMHVGVPAGEVMAALKRYPEAR